MTVAGSLRDEVERVVATDNCSGCGLCAQLSPSISMDLNAEGYLRPCWTENSENVESPNSKNEFLSSCPGVLVKASDLNDAYRHPILGPYVSIWEAWALDPEIRNAGSSGGTITMLVSWLLETGRYNSSTAVGQAPSDARRTQALTLTTREEALRSAGSRYAPVGAAEMCNLGADDDSTIFVGKPCEASAIRQVLEVRGKSTRPLILSFFCAGTPSQLATEGLITQMGFGDPSTEVTSLRYRGDGWPGDFVVRTAAGGRGSCDYNESWGKHLGPATQWRCKICPDGVGENSDITAGDFWHADDRGYPSFEEEEGVSVLIARTRRGDDLIRQAIEEGVLGARPASPDDVARVQPLQVKRRATLAGRMLGARLGGRRVPRYQGFNLLALARISLIASAKSVGGTFLRVRAAAGRANISVQKELNNGNGTSNG